MMSAMDIITLGAAGAAVSYVSYLWGKRSKLRELHALQDEGFLTITYNKQLTGGTAEGPTMHELLHEHEQRQPDDPLGEVRYIRRDQDGPRRDDWARTMQARKLAERSEQEPDPEPEPPAPSPKAIEE